ncbi:hypothetical protein [Cryptosporangium sp. NPDC051539]|uniref:hypothetical protein n=1 Tax=Cryptosporangium sp. NPDC051539 TaxID=3363962 RepID=UPI0037B7461C
MAPRVEVATVSLGLEAATVEVRHVDPAEHALGVVPGRSAAVMTPAEAADRLVECVLDTPLVPAQGADDRPDQLVLRIHRLTALPGGHGRPR